MRSFFIFGVFAAVFALLVTPLDRPQAESATPAVVSPNIVISGFFGGGGMRPIRLSRTTTSSSSIAAVSR